MFRILGTFLATAGLLTTVACTALKNPVSPASNGGTVAVSVKFSTPKAGAPALAKAPITDFTTGVVTLTKGATTQSAPITIANGRASANIPGLEAGVWTITLNFYNATGNLTYTGTASVTVQNGVTSSVSITIDPVSGSISFDFDLPLDPGDLFVGNYIQSGTTTMNGQPYTIFWNNGVLTFRNVNGVTSIVTSIVNDREVILGANNARCVLSADGSTITSYYTVDGLPYPNEAWERTGTPLIRQ